MTSTSEQHGIKKPYKLYRVIKGRTPQDRSIWTQVATCWPHKDGHGFNVQFKFNEAPVSGATYVMRRDQQRSAVSVGDIK